MNIKLIGIFLMLLGYGGLDAQTTNAQEEGPKTETEEVTVITKDDLMLGSWHEADIADIDAELVLSILGENKMLRKAWIQPVQGEKYMFAYTEEDKSEEINRIELGLIITWKPFDQDVIMQKEYRGIGIFEYIGSLLEKN
jgi:hypothetical protein